MWALLIAGIAGLSAWIATFVNHMFVTGNNATLYENIFVLGGAGICFSLLFITAIGGVLMLLKNTKTATQILSIVKASMGR